MTIPVPVPGSPDVSVVIATRARPELLRTTLRSIIAQDYPGRLQMVVVFDQSPIDDSLTADLDGLDGVDAFSEAREPGGVSSTRSLLMIENDCTPGLAGARNAGVRRATGGFVAFCDDDDTWRPAKVSHQIAALLGSGADLAVCGIEITIGEKTHTRLPRPEDMTVEQLSRRRVMEAHPSTVLISRASLDRIGPVDEVLPGSYGEDYDWMLRALAATRSVVVEEPLVRVLWHQGSFFSTRWQTIIDALDYLIDKHASIRDSRPGLARIYGQQAFAYAALGDRPRARHRALSALRLDPTERRSYLALLVTSRLVSARSVVDFANSRGRGI